MGEHRAGISSNRRWWLLAGAIVVFLLAFDLLQGLFERPPGEPGEAPAETAGAEPDRPSNRPTLHRRDDGAIEIRMGLLHRSRVRLGSEEDRTALFECLQREIDRTFVAGSEDWAPLRVRMEMDRVKDACLESIAGLPQRPGN